MTHTIKHTLSSVLYNLRSLQRRKYMHNRFLDNHYDTDQNESGESIESNYSVEELFYMMSEDVNRNEQSTAFPSLATEDLLNTEEQNVNSNPPPTEPPAEFSGLIIPKESLEQIVNNSKKSVVSEDTSIIWEKIYLEVHPTSNKLFVKAEDTNYFASVQEISKLSFKNAYGYLKRDHSRDLSYSGFDYLDIVPEEREKSPTEILSSRINQHVPAEKVNIITKKKNITPDKQPLVIWDKVILCKDSNRLYLMANDTHDFPELQKIKNLLEKKNILIHSSRKRSGPLSGFKYIDIDPNEVKDKSLREILSDRIGQPVPNSVGIYVNPSEINNTFITSKKREIEPNNTPPQKNKKREIEYKESEDVDNNNTFELTTFSNSFFSTNNSLKQNEILELTPEGINEFVKKIILQSRSNTANPTLDYIIEQINLTLPADAIILEKYQEKTKELIQNTGGEALSLFLRAIVDKQKREFNKKI